MRIRRNSTRGELVTASSKVGLHGNKNFQNSLYSRWVINKFFTVIAVSLVALVPKFK